MQPDQNPGNHSSARHRGLLMASVNLPETRWHDNRKSGQNAPRLLTQEYIMMTCMGCFHLWKCF